MKKRVLLLIFIALLFLGTTWNMSRDVIFKGNFFYHLDSSEDSLFVSDDSGIRLWRGNDVGDAIDGRLLVLYRTATEGRDSIMIYIDADQKARIVTSDGSVYIDNKIITNTVVAEEIFASSYNFADADAVGGTGDAITLDYDPDLPSSATMVTFIAEANNTGATTINIDESGAINVYEAHDISALEANDIKNGMAVMLIFDGTQWQQVNQSGN
jgi:hypothetical protein